MPPTNQQLLQFIIDHFSNEDFDELCFSHFEEVRSSFGIETPLSRKARIIIDFCKHRDRLNDLYKVIASERPKAWNEQYLTSPTPPLSQFWIPFLNRVINEHRDWHLPDELLGLIDWETSPVPIEEYFRLQPIIDKPLLPKEQGRKVKHHTEPLLKLSDVQAERLVVLLGSAGSGKSTCLRYLCYSLSHHALKTISENPGTRDFHVPILIPLKHFGSVDLLSLLYAHLRAREIRINHQDVQNLLESGQATFLLDGFDEVGEEFRRDLISQIEWLRELLPNNAIFLTSREQEIPLRLTGFKKYRVQELDRASIDPFIKYYLGEDYQTFDEVFKDFQVADLVRTPLLLVLCIILVHKSEESLESVTDVYQQIVGAYQSLWESHKGKRNSFNRIAWIILERFLARLAHQMVLENYSHELTQEQVLKSYTAEVVQLRNEALWSERFTILDIVNQLQSHNLLTVEGNTVSFWHASFRDYFCAVYLSTRLKEELAAFAEKPENTSIVAFLIGLIDDSDFLVKLLTRNVIEGRSFQHRIGALHALASLGSKYTTEIVRAVSSFNYDEVIGYANQILKTRSFKGADIYWTTMELIYDGQWPYFQDEGFIDVSLLEDIEQVSNWSLQSPFRDAYKIEELSREVLLSIANGQIENAKVAYYCLEQYLQGHTGESEELDPWLNDRGFQDGMRFVQQLRFGHIEEIELQNFCRNTYLITSLPFVIFIRDNTNDSITKLEANLAVHCIRQRYGLPLY